MEAGLQPFTTSQYGGQECYKLPTRDKATFIMFLKAEHYLPAASGKYTIYERDEN